MYNKLFSKIVDSSIWLEPSPTRIVWVMFIAVMDEDGFVAIASPANVAHKARITEAEAEEALRILESPDPNSANHDNEGRRLERVAGGWMVINAPIYRNLVTREVSKEQTRLRVAAFRERKRIETQGNAPVTEANGSVTPSEAVSEAEVPPNPLKGEGAKRPSRPEMIRCTQKEAEDYCESIGLPRSDGTAMFLHWEEKGWAKVKDWRLTIQKWRSFSYLPSQKKRGFQNEDLGKPKSKREQEFEERWRKTHR